MCTHCPELGALLLSLAGALLIAGVGIIAAAIALVRD